MYNAADNKTYVYAADRVPFWMCVIFQDYVTQKTLSLTYLKHNVVDQ